MNHRSSGGRGPRLHAVPAVLAVLAILSFAYAAFVAVAYAHQTLLDAYFFRQTQTALTSFWMAKDGFSLAYETPVGGAPWSLPFEFPLYQYIVALISNWTASSLTAVGRLVSFVFLVLCLWPARAIVRLLKLDPSVFPVFAILLLSSPIYLYWGRTFMIETAGVFLAVAAIRYFIDIAQGAQTKKNVALFLLLMTLCVLQKATTALPVLAAMGLVYFFVCLGDLRARLASRSPGNAGFILKRVALAALYVGLPLVIGVAWTSYTDRVKSLNPLGLYLTSEALWAWNWGTLAQRLSAALYVDVLWKRVFVENLSGLLGAATLLLLFFSPAAKAVKRIVGVSLALGFVPLLLFPKLHLAHTYYQSATAIFAIFALAVSLVHLFGRAGRGGDIRVLLLVLVMAASNYFWFSSVHLGVVQTDYDRGNSRDYAIAEVLKRELPEDKAFVAFGNDWNSSLAFLSERKSFTVPGFMKGYEEQSRNPENYIAAGMLGGVSLCPPNVYPTVDDLLRWSAGKGNWKVGQARDCHLAFPEKSPVPAGVNAMPTQCLGSIDLADVQATEGGGKVLSIFGWTVGEPGASLGAVYVTLTPQGAAPRYLEALQVWRPDVNSVLGRPADDYLGFSRVLDADSLRGAYTVGVARMNRGVIEQCQFRKEISIGGR